MKPNPIVWRRRQMRTLVQAIAAIALAIVAEGILYGRTVGLHIDVASAVALFALAAFLMFRAAGQLPPLEKQDGVAPRAFLGFSDLETIGWSCGIVGVCTNATALVIFGNNVSLNLAWALYVSSIACAVASAYFLDDRDHRSFSFSRPRYEVVAVVLILLLAAFFRLDQFGSLPAGLWFDEANQGLASERILADPGYRPVWLAGLSPDPAMRLYWQALFFLVLGPSKLALRLIPALGGLLGVCGAYLLGRELFGWRTGLVTASLLAVLSWHVNFSRIDLSGIWAVAFDALAAYFVVKAFRTHRYFDYGMAGLCLGLGINSYYTSYLFCAVIALYVLYRWLDLGRSFLRASLGGLILFAFVLVLTVSPLGEFAILHRDEYASRYNQVNILNEIRDQGSLAPLINNVSAHALMFNYAGDKNGRHNESGWPEFDRVTGALFLLGLVICLRNWRRPSYLFPLLSLGIILLGGILSVDFEAPQSVRTMDNSLTGAILAALPIEFVWSRLANLRLGRVTVPLGSFGVASLSSGALLAIALLGWVAGLNFVRYFAIQARDNASYAAFSIGPTLLAEAANRLGPDYDVYMSATFVDQPTISFLAPWIKPETAFDPTKDLPLHDRRNVAIFLETRDSDYLNAIHRLYPAAAVQEFRLSPKDPVQLYAAVVPFTEIGSVQGLSAAYFPGKTTDVPAKIDRVDSALNFDWSAQPPLSLPFVASWQGVVLAPVYGSYQVRLAAPAGSILKIDQREVLHGNAQVSLVLAQGLHAVDLVAPFTDPGVLRLSWKMPGGSEEIVPANDLFHQPADNRGLLARFYRDADWSGEPALERIDVSLSQRFHFLPLPQPFTVDWIGKIDIPRAGIYRFATQSIDYSWLYVDNKLVVDNSHDLDHYVEGSLNLSEGLHDIRVSFVDRTGHSFIDVYWQPPGASRSFLPGDRLFPPQASYPERAGPLAGPSPTTVEVAAPSAAPPTGSTQSPPSKLPASPLKVRQTFGAPGTGAGRVSDPRGVAVDRDGNVYVVDTGNRRVVEFGPDGSPLRVIGSPDQFQEPVAAAITPTGNVAILDAMDGWISLYSPAGALISKIGGPSDQFYHPRGLTVDPAGNFFVADTGTAHVVVLSPAGALVRKLGDPAKKPGAGTQQPVSVAVDSRGSYYVTDAGNSLLLAYNQAFDEQGSWVLPSFDSVRGAHALLAPDASLYVTDPGNHRVLHFDSGGKLQDQLGGDGTLSQPVGIANDANGDVYVADAAAGKVVEFGR